MLDAELHLIRIGNGIQPGFRPEYLDYDDCGKLNAAYSTPIEILWNPKEGNRILDGTNSIQSPALILLHEFAHAHQYMTNKQVYERDYDRKRDDGYTNDEEYRVITGPETTAAHAAGEPTRNCHSFPDGSDRKCTEAVYEDVSSVTYSVNNQVDEGKQIMKETITVLLFIWTCLITGKSFSDEKCDPYKLPGKCLGQHISVIDEYGFALDPSQNRHFQGLSTFPNQNPLGLNVRILVKDDMICVVRYSHITGRYSISMDDFEKIKLDIISRYNEFSWVEHSDSSGYGVVNIYNDGKIRVTISRYHVNFSDLSGCGR
ncbi:Effector protein [Halopseudomonas yangmingensis]|uniref:Effector protein n=2 Tax=Halopseudomonas yangmingensis TaxID=1720063 RepID=A0A1I4UMS9_9GAMM|nr:M91 family zinc metallopeptidase [Halopseudomonas yangmingensis]SFM90238.1 Effector protein [Halopseudomonas yangmingensis]